MSKLIRNSASHLLEKTIHNLPIKQHKFIMRTCDGYYNWPGFYAGITNKFSNKSYSPTGYESNFFPVWIIPKLTKYETRDTMISFSLKIFQRMLLNILETNGIQLYDDVQINLNVLDHEQIIVNPYDTRVVKFDT